MSVVNQMLKDLEDRQADEQGVSAVYHPSPETKSNRSSTVIIILLVLLLLIATGAVVVWLMQSQSSTNNTITADTAGPEQSLEAAKPMVVRSSPEIVVETPAEQTRAEQPAEAVQNDVNEADVVDEQEALSSVAVETTPPAPDVSVVSTMIPDEPESTSVEEPETAPPPVFSKQSASQRESSLSLREQAQIAVRAGQDQQAINLLEKLLATEQNNVAVRKKLAALLFSQGNALRSQSVLEQGIALSPTDASQRLMLARLLEQQSQLEAAFNALETEQPLQGVNAEFLGYRAGLADRLQNYSAAFDDYRSLTQSQPYQAKWWLGLGIASERTQRPQMALLAYRQAASLGQLSADVQRFIQQRISVLVGTQ